MRDRILESLKESLSTYIQVDDLSNLTHMSFQELGLQSMAVVGIFLELESKGWIDITMIDNDFPPNNIEDIIKLAELTNSKKHE